MLRLLAKYARMEEVIGEAQRLHSKKIIPPKFILQATIKQMQGFADPSPGRNPFVTVLADKMAAIETIPAAKRAASRPQIYPVWKKAAALLGGRAAQAVPNSADIRICKPGKAKNAHRAN